MNDESRGTYNTNSQIIFKTSMLRWSLCYYSDEYILVSGTITVAKVTAGRRNNGIQVDNVKYIDVVTPMFNLIEYSHKYSKASGSLWQYYRYETAFADHATPANSPVNSASLKLKQNITGSPGDDSTKNVEIMVPLKYLSNFWRFLEMPLINCETNLILTGSSNCVRSNAAANKATTLPITDTKLFVPVVTLSIDDNAKLLEQLKWGF